MPVEALRKEFRQRISQNAPPPVATTAVSSLAPNVIKPEHRHWLFLLFAFRGTVIAHILSRLLILTSVAAALSILNHFNIYTPPFHTTAHSVLGVALSLLLVFRTNASQDRFWEGRKLWGGIVVSCRNIMRAIHSYVDLPDPSSSSPSAERVDTVVIANLLTAWVMALKQRLRGDNSTKTYATFLMDHPDYLRFVSRSPNKPMLILALISNWIGKNCRGRCPDEIMRQLEVYVATLADMQGGCERINTTPIPFSYLAHINHIIALYLLTLPFALVGEYGWYTVAAVLLVGFGMLGIEQAGIEIEDPFGTSRNDLPLDALCAAINENTHILIKEVIHHRPRHNHHHHHHHHQGHSHRFSAGSTSTNTSHTSNNNNNSINTSNTTSSALLSPSSPGVPTTPITAAFEEEDYSSGEEADRNSNNDAGCGESDGDDTNGTTATATATTTTATAAAAAAVVGGGSISKAITNTNTNNSNVNTAATTTATGTRTNVDRHYHISVHIHSSSNNNNNSEEESEQHHITTDDNNDDDGQRLLPLGQRVSSSSSVSSLL